MVISTKTNDNSQNVDDNLTYLIGIYYKGFTILFRKLNQDEFLEFDDKVMEDEEAKAKSESDFDINVSLEKLGLHNDDIKKHPIAMNGSYMSFLVLRHLKIKDMKTKVCSTFFNQYLILLKSN